MKTGKIENKDKFLSGLNKKDRHSKRGVIVASCVTTKENVGIRSYVFSLLYGYGASPLNRA